MSGSVQAGQEQFTRGPRSKQKSPSVLEHAGGQNPLSRRSGAVSLAGYTATIRHGGLGVKETNDRQRKEIAGNSR